MGLDSLVGFDCLHALLLLAMHLPCPTYQLWHFPSARENDPKFPIWDAQNDYLGAPWIGLLVGTPTYSLLGNTEILRIFPGISPEDSWGSGEDKVDIFCSGGLCLEFQHATS